ncbi:SdrD B-like domain-containing protein [Rudanella paleaurantiibacter]|nr:SdrD B-like domain-containing protein [Rudanella paleaurantiibacter]
MANAQVSGTVFRDYNGNGIKDAGEGGVSGVTVTAYFNATLTSAISTTAGSYSFAAATIPSGTSVRLEFTGFPTGDYSGPFSSNSAGNGTSVQFVTAGAAAASINFGVNLPNDYCQANPRLVTTCYINGDNNTTAPVDAMVSWNYTDSGTTTTNKKTVANKSQIGSAWGVAYSKTRKRIYTAAFLKRHVGVGPGGLGAIYISDPNATSTNASVFITVPNAGTIASNANRGLGAPSALNADPTAFSLVGAIGLGDLDISEDEQYLYVTNLNDKRIYIINIDTQTIVTSVAVPDPGCTGGDFRPFGLAYRNGNLYVGVTCDASISNSRDDLKAFVYEMDGATNTFSTTPVLQFNLNYRRTQAWNTTFLTAQEQSRYWHPWVSTYNTTTLSGAPVTAADWSSHPTPLLSDMVFDTDGSMILGFIDRTSHQIGAINYQPTGNSSNNLQENNISGGDILRATVSGTTWTIEPLNYTTTGTPLEFYSGEFYSTDHYETAQGGLALVKGKGEVVTIAMDPTVVRTGGIIKLSNTTGTQTGNFQVFSGENPFFGKATGLGDLEALCDVAPIEIGNRIWQDYDRDGIQDPNEPGIPNVVVTLYKSNTLIASATTNTNGGYYFSSASGTNTTSAIYNLTALTPGTSVQLRIAQTQTALASFSLTAADQGTSDAIDSDFAPSAVGSTTAVANVTLGVTGQNDHTFDAGVYVCPTITFTSPGANTQYCGKGTATFTVSTNALSPDGIRLVAYPVAVDPYSTTITPAFVTSVASSTVLGTKTLTFSNVQLPDNLSGTNTSLFVYAILVSADGLCKPVSSLTITLKPRPNTVIGGPQQVCTGSTATLLADTYNGRASYQWFVESGTVLVSGNNPYTTTAINATTTYRVRLTLDGCVSDDASITVTPVPCTPCTASATSLGGKVYRDFDSDGTADANDLTMSGITVTLFRCDATNQSSQVATMQSDLNGAYSFTGLTAGTTYRVEFSNLPAGYKPTYRGTNNGTTVQFTQPGSCTTSLGINQPIDYCQTNPFMVIPCYLNGASNSNADALVKFDYNNTGITPKPTELAHASEVASVWGVAYGRQTKQLYTATFLKRHVGLRDINNDGKGDLGLIWQTSNPTSTTSINTVWADLTAAPYNLDLGTIGNDASRGLGATSQPNNDPTSFPLVGKVGLGDLDISDDNSALWVVNPKQNQLHKIAINADGSAGGMTTFNLPNACSNAFDTLYVQAGGTNFSRVNGGFVGDNFYVGGSPTTTGQSGVPYAQARSGTSFSYRIPLPNGTYNIQLYVGTQVSVNQNFTVAGTTQSFTATANSRQSVLVSNAIVTNGLLDIVAAGNAGSNAYLSGIKIWSATGNQLADRSYPFALKYHNGKVYVGTTCPAEVSQDFAHLSSTVYELVDNGSTTFTPVLTLPLNYAKGATSGASCNGNKWHPWLPVMPGTCIYIFSYEEPVLSDIEFDVDGSMILGYFDRFTHQIGNANYPPTGTNLIYSASGGDILRACYVNGVFHQPGSPNCPNNAANNQGPTGGEFYAGDVAADLAQEATQGGLALLPGRNEVATNGYDVETVRDGGVYWLNNRTGAKNRTYEVYPNMDNATGNFAKGTSLGDLEVLCDLAPIQIGNRVWRDDNANGIQDPCEPPIPGAVVTLYDATKTTAYASVTTSAAGEYYFSSTTITVGNSTSSVATTALTYNTGYAVVLTSLGTSTVVTGLSLTNVSPVTPSESGTANSGSSQVNNDAILVNGKPCIGVTTGEPGSNNHTYDFGITIPECAKPEIAVSKSQTICQGGSFSLPLSATIISNTVTSGLQWYFTDASGSSFTAISGATSLTFSPTTAQLPTATGGVRYYAIMGQNGLSTSCAATAFVTLQIDPIVTVAFNSPAANTQYCGNGTATFTVSTNATAPAGIKLLAFTTATDPYSTTITPAFVTSVASSTATGTKTLTFSNVQLPDNLTGANMGLFVYAVLVSPTTSACQPPQASLIITLKPRPNTVIGGPTQVCTGSTATLSANAFNGATYQWYAGSGTAVVGSTNPYTTPAISATTTYRVRLTLASCVSDEASFTVTPVPCTSCTASATSLGGKVYRDFDSDGTADANDPNMSGITVTLFRCDATNQSTQVAQMQTDLNGAYSFTGLTAGTTYRVEFSNLPAGYEPTYRGLNNGTTVQFTQPGSCTTSLGINQPADFCQTNPMLVTPCYLDGAVTPNTTAFDDVLVGVNYDLSGSIYHLAMRTQIGSTWGVAYAKTAKKLYTAAFLKRHVGLKDGNLGQIYILDMTNPTSASATITPWLNVSSLAGVAGNWQFATDAQRGLTNAGTPSLDAQSFSLVAGIGLGDIDISEDEKTLYVMDLTNKQLLAIDIASKTLTGKYPVPELCSTTPSTGYFSAGSNNATFTANDGKQWQKGYLFDIYGSSGNYNQTITNPNSVTAGTGDAALYTNSAFVNAGSTMTYSFPVGNGTFGVKLHMATNATSNGRNTSVALESTTVLSGFDVYAAAGNQINVGIIRSFTTTVTDGVLTIAITANTGGGQAMVSGFELTTLNGTPTGETRPFALAVHNGKVYVGAVCDASHSQSRADLQASVLEFDPVAGSYNPTPILSFPLTYTHGPSYDGCSNLDLFQWHPWTSIYPNGIGCSGGFLYVQPTMSDIVFDADSSLIMGFFDRFQHQTGANIGQYAPDYTPSNGRVEGGVVGGDLLRAYFNGSSYELEYNGKEGSSSPKPTTSGQNNGDGIGGGEFYIDNFLGHHEISVGGIAFKPGSGEIRMSVGDPLAYNSGGLTGFNNTTGAKQNGITLYSGTTGGTQNKANGLGDLEVLCDLAPIQIGNRVWRDDNANGIQDPCEPAIPSAVVRLYDAAKTTILASATTNAAGEYYFQSGTVVAGTSTSAVTTTALTYNTTYALVISSLGTSTVVSSQALALTDVSPLTPGEIGTVNTGLTQINNDAKVDVVGGISSPCIRLTTGGPGETNHTYDFGIVKSTCVPPSVTVLANATTLCQDNSVTAYANVSPAGSYTYSWAAPQGVTLTGTSSATVTATNLTTGTNTFTLTVSSSPVCLTTTTVSVTVTALPVPTVVSQTICAGQPAVLTVQNCAGAVQWSASANNATSQSITVSPTTTTTYSVSCSVNGCVGWTTATVTVNGQPVINSMSAGICVGNTASVSVSASATSGSLEYSFNGGAFTPANTFTLTAPAPTTVTVVVRTVGTSCTVSQSIPVNCACQTPATVSLLPTTLQTCAGSPVSFTAGVAGATSATLTSSGTGIFSNAVVMGSVTPTYTPSAADVSAGSVTLTIISNDPDGVGLCSVATQSRVLTINPLPTVSLTSATICAGQTATLAASGASSYSFISAGSIQTGNQYVVSPTQTTVYSVTGTTNAGCTHTASGTVTVSPAVTVSITGNLSICTGQSTTLAASGGAGTTYRWNTNETTATISVSVAGSYSVTATSSAGCNHTASTSITVNPLPVLTVTSATICAGQTATLTVGGASTYRWSSGVTGPLLVVAPTATTVYSVTGTTTAGCSAVSSGTVVVNGQPQINGIRQSTACVGNVASLTVDAINTGAGVLEYSLNGGAFQTNNSFTLSAPTTVTAVIVVRTQGSSCSVTESVVVNCACQTPVSLTFVPTTLQTCATTPVSFTAGVAGATSATLTSSGTGIFSQNVLVNNGVQLITYTPSLADATAGSVTLTLMSADPDGSGSCVADQIVRTLTINSLPSVSATSASICAGGVATLNASGASTFRWSNGATTAAISVSVAGIYSVTGVSAQGCSNVASGTLTISPTPTLGITRRWLTTTSTALLTATGCVGGRINWSTGATNTASITVPVPTNTTTVYAATCTMGTGCTANAVISFNTTPGGEDNLQVSNALVCQGSPAVLTATGCSQGNLLWSTNVQTSSISVAGQTASYTVTCTDNKGQLIAVGSVSAVSASSVTVAAIPGETVPVGSSVSLVASGCTSGTLNWSTGMGDSGKSLVVVTPTLGSATYSVTCVSGVGCVSSASVVVVGITDVQPNVLLQKVASKTRSKIGEVVSFTITLTNSGGTSATSIVVSDTFSAGLSLVPGSAFTASGTFTTGINGGQWLLTSIPAGATATLTYSASVVAEGVLYNTASIPGQEVSVCLSVPIRVCKGLPFALRLLAPVGFSRYQWYLTAPGASSSTLVSDSGQESFTATALGEYHVQVDNGQCPNGSCCPVVIEETEVPSYTALVKQPSCVGSTPQGNGEIRLANLGTDPYVYQVSRGTSFSASEALTAAAAVPMNGVVGTGLLPGNYTVRVWLLINGEASCPRDLSLALVDNCSCPAGLCVPITVRKVKR